MRPIVTGRSVGRSVTIVSPAKTVEPIDMPFGLWTLVGLSNHVLDGFSDSSKRNLAFFWRNGRSIVKYRDLLP